VEVIIFELICVSCKYTPALLENFVSEDNYAAIRQMKKVTITATAATR